jgi:hypothetical protein
MAKRLMFSSILVGKSAFRGVIVGPILTIPKFSSDLFVTYTVSGAVDQQFQAGVSYASGGAAGKFFQVSGTRGSFPFALRGSLLGHDGVRRVHS